MPLFSLRTTAYQLLDKSQEAQRSNKQGLADLLGEGKDTKNKLWLKRGSYGRRYGSA